MTHETNPRDAIEQNRPPLMTIQQRLRMKADMITMGERITFGSECEIMHEAAGYIDQLLDAMDKCVEALEFYGDRRNYLKDATDYVEPLQHAMKRIEGAERRKK